MKIQIERYYLDDSYKNAKEVLCNLHQDNDNIFFEVEGYRYEIPKEVFFGILGKGN